MNVLGKRIVTWRFAVMAAVVLNPASMRAQPQMASSYRQAAQAYREAAAKAPADQRNCYLLWASYYDGLAASLATGGPAPPAEPQVDPYCRSGQSGVNASSFSTGSNTSPATAGSSGWGTALTTGLEALQGYVARRAEADRQRRADAKAEQLRREREAEARSTPQSELLVFSASYGDESRVLKSLLAGVPVDARNSYDQTALYAATEKNDIWMIKLLLKHGAATEAEDTWGITPFIVAAEDGALQAALVLLAAGANSYHDPYMPAMQSAIEKAEFFGNEDILRIIRYVKKPDAALRARLARLGPVTAAADELNRAAARGNLDELNGLLSSGLSPDSPDELTFAPLHNAVLRGKVEIVAALLAKGADVNAVNTFGQTALMLAARRLRRCKDCSDASLQNSDAKKILDLVLAAGAKKDPRDFVGYSALDHFLKSGWGAKDQNRLPTAKSLATALAP